MKTVLQAWAVLSLLVAVLVLSNAKSVFHEIEAGVGFLSFAIALCGWGVIEAIETQTIAQRDRWEADRAEDQAADEEEEKAAS